MTARKHEATGCAAWALLACYTFAAMVFGALMWELIFERWLR